MSAGRSPARGTTKAALPSPTRRAERPWSISWSSTRTAVPSAGPARSRYTTATWCRAIALHQVAVVYLDLARPALGTAVLVDDQEIDQGRSALLVGEGNAAFVVPLAGLRPADIPGTEDAWLLLQRPPLLPV